MDYYQIFKIISASIFLAVALITYIVGRNNQSPFYLNWVFFTLTYSIYELSLYFVYSNPENISCYQIVQTIRAIMITLLLGACLQQSRLLEKKSTRFFLISVLLFMIYIIWVPLAIEETVSAFRDVEVVVFYVFYTDMFGLIFGLQIVIAGFFLIPILKRYTKSISSDNKIKYRRKIFFTIISILLIMCLGVIIMVRRVAISRNLNYFKILESVFSLIIVTFISIYHSQSISHGIQAVLVVDKEGNPIVGYSPQKREEISFEAKIIAASGFLSSLFHFVKNYIASTTEEEFKELKTTSSSLLFYAGNKFYLIVQTVLTSTRLEETSKKLITEIDFYLRDLETNKMPTKEQVEDLYFILDKTYYTMA